MRSVSKILNFSLKKTIFCRFFYLVLAIASLTSIVHGNLSLQCIVSYLRTHDAYEDIFSNVEEFGGSDAECESFIRIKIDDFNEKVVEKMEEDEKVKNLVDCFKHEIHNSNEYEIITLKLQGVGLYIYFSPINLKFKLRIFT